MATEPLSQDEKDQIGQAEMDERRAAEQARTPGRPTRANWVPDDQLDGLTKDGLLAEAELRRVQVKASAAKPEIIDALRGKADESGEEESEEEV